MRDKAFKIAKNLNYYGYQRRLASMVYKYFDKITSDSGIKRANMSNKELAEELHKLIIRKSNKRKVHPPFIDNIWDANLADMQFISKFNKGIRFSLWVIPLKDKIGITITNTFQKILKDSNLKPSKIW